MRSFLPAAILAATLITTVPASMAQAMTVQPVVLNLKVAGSGMSQVVTVENSFSTPLPVELRGEELVFQNNVLTNTHKEAADLMVFPPQAMIQPGQTQSFRVQYVGDPDLAQSRHYYITVAQLPVKLPQGQSAIQILYNFQVLVSVAPSGVQPALKIASAGVTTNAQGKPMPSITITNASNAHGYLSNGRLALTQRDASGKEIFSKTISGPELLQIIGFGLVGANTTRTIMIPVELPAANGVVDARLLGQ